MLYLEPDLLVWTDQFDYDDLPNLDLESADDTLKVAKLWDINGLLVLKPGLVEQHLHIQQLQEGPPIARSGTDVEEIKEKER